MLLNCGVEDSWESPGLQGDPTSPSLKEISPGCSLERLLLKLKSQYFGHLMRRDNRGWDGWMASLIQWTWVWVNCGSWWWTGRPGVAVVHGVGKSRAWLSDWTELTDISLWLFNVLFLLLLGCNEPTNVGNKRHRFVPSVGKIPWRRACQLTPVFLPGEYHGQSSTVGYSS